MRVLVVQEAFGGYARGSIIRDAAEIEAVQGAGQAHFCTAAEVADDFFPASEPVLEPEPEPAPAAPKSKG